MADVEKLLVAALAARFPAPARVVTETPEDLDRIPRTVKVTRAGGPKLLILDRPRIVLDCYGIASPDQSAREAARAFALEVADFMEYELPHTALADGVFVTKVRVDSRPSSVPDANPALRHFAATYSPTIRANRAA